MMEKSMKFLKLALFFSTTLFADQFTLDNQTSHPKIAIQWSPSAKGVQERNEAILQKDPISPKDLYFPTQSKANITIPKKAAYFRVLIWDAVQDLPEYLTNWIEFVPGKTYHLKQEHLIPVLLMPGMGC
jgi:hypothetical protein